MHIPKPLGIIDTFSLGFSVVNRHLWLLAISILLELVVSSGPKVTAGPVAQQALALYRESLESMPEEMRNSSSAPSIQDTREMIEEAVQPISSFNILSLLLWQVPSLASGSLTYFGNSIGFEIADFSMLVLVSLAVLIFGLMATSLYLTAVATFVRGDVSEQGRNAPEGHDQRERFDLVEFYKRLQVNWFRLVAFYGLLTVVVLILGITGTAIVGAVTLLNQSIGSTLVGLGFAIILLAMLYLFFSDEAIVMEDKGPLAAARTSISLVYKNYRASLMLAVLTTVITVGTHLIWMSLSNNILGSFVGMVGNAYVSTGLTASVMLFYSHRSQFLQKEAAPG